MQDKGKTTAVFLLLILTLSCAGKNFSDRHGGSSDSSSHENGNSQGIVKPSDETVAPTGYQNAAAPVPINGVNLVEVFVSTYCVKKPNDPCMEVRLGAKFKVDSKEAVHFGSNTIGPYGIKSHSWEFKDLSPGINCQSLVGGFAFNPLCTSSSGSLAETPIQATLSLVASDGAVFKGDAPNSNPIQNIVQGNFMLLDASAGFTPTRKTVNGDTAPSAGLQLFTQIWAVLKGNEPYLDSLKNVSYVTNILYFRDANSPTGTDWEASVDLCKNKLNSGNGTNKWRLAAVDELCGSGYINPPCNGGLAKHDIKNVTVEGGIWNPYVWSSSPADNTPGYAWAVSFNDMHVMAAVNSSDENSVICVR